MWIILYLISMIISIIPLTSEITAENDFHERLPQGYVHMEEHFQKNGFQDYTDYCKYYYNDATVIESDERFSKITLSDVDEVKGFFKDTQNIMESEGRMDEFDFNESCISEGDYVYIIEDTDVSKQKYYNYDVFLFDTDSDTLYFIHSNK